MKELERLLMFLALGANYSIVNTSIINVTRNLFSQLNNFNPLSIFNPPTFIELASRHGHSAESHEVITGDGYILTMFRIRGNRSRLPVLLFHGILDSSDTWIIRGKTSLGISLANKNYDVWFGNVRGNRYSRRHTHLNPDEDAAFWNFSFEQHGLLDLPAHIDYMINETGTKKINIIGHSQGTVIIWTMLSTKTQYNDKINVATALAPICYVNNILPPALTIGQFLPPLRSMFQALGMTSVLGDDTLVTITFRVISRIPFFGYLILAHGFLFPMFGTDSTELEPNFLPTITSHVPTWTSMRNLLHYAQLTSTDQFARFDYGEIGNLEAYNSSTPPVYELGKINAKVILLAALNDNLSQLIDVDNLRRQLPNVVRYIVNSRAAMNHLDYIWGRTATDYLHKYIHEALEDYD